ncbi:MAG: glutamyl-tRNA reductase [Saprospiraceae bacterium]
MTSVQLIGISHETANLSIRSLFHLNQSEKQEFINTVKARFDIKGIFLLGTCNRTEIYFESINTTTIDILNCLLELKNKSRNTENVLRITDYVQFFIQKETTKSTMKYLLEVVSGLRSLVVGDMQIISQFKESFLFSQKLGLQGQILERIAQTIFKMHKRIQNETDFRKGSASTSYLALLATRSHFGKENLVKKKVLLVGAGEIIKDVAKYSDKFTFKNITITNRTMSKAVTIANQYDFGVTDWSNLNQEVINADIIISGVSNQANLISKTIGLEKQNSEKLFIDLGMPGNIDTVLENNQSFRLINIDALNTKSEQVEAKRQNAINAVKGIIYDEYETFLKWLTKLPVNRSLGKLKNHIQDLLTREMETQFDYLTEVDRQKIISRLSQQLIKQPAITLNKKAEKNTELAKALETVFAL